MSLVIVYQVDCPHCGEPAESRTLHVDQPEPDGTVRIDVELSVGQTQFECTSCDCAPYVGDIDPYLDGECDTEGADEDDEEVAGE